MGLFTTIRHPDGREFQIKCGWDDMETYALGERVRFRIIAECPGEAYLADGVYSGCGYPGGDAWVVIKDHYVLALVPRQEDPAVQGVLLREWFAIEGLPRTLWPEDMWIAHEKRQAEIKAEVGQMMEGAENSGEAVARMLRYDVDQPGFAKRIFPVKPEVVRWEKGNRRTAGTHRREER